MSAGRCATGYDLVKKDRPRKRIKPVTPTLESLIVRYPQRSHPDWEFTPLHPSYQPVPFDVRQVGPFSRIELGEFVRGGKLLRFLSHRMNLPLLAIAFAHDCFVTEISREEPSCEAFNQIPHIVLISVFTSYTVNSASSFHATLYPTLCGLLSHPDSPWPASPPPFIAIAQCSSNEGLYGIAKNSQSGPDSRDRAFLLELCVDDYFMSVCCTPTEVEEAILALVGVVKYGIQIDIHSKEMSHLRGLVHDCLHGYELVSLKQRYRDLLVVWRAA